VSNDDLTRVSPESKQLLANSLEELGRARISEALDATITTRKVIYSDNSKFKAVVLSGFRTRDNKSGVDNIDSNLDSDFIIVRPIDDYSAIPDPLDHSNLEKYSTKNYVKNIEQRIKLNYTVSTIELHATKFTARFEKEGAIDKNKPNFGEIVDCFYEAGATIGDPSKLRYRDSAQKRAKHPPYENFDMSVFDIDAPNDAKNLWINNNGIAKVGDYDLQTPKGPNGESRYKYNLSLTADHEEGRPIDPGKLQRAKYFAEQGLSSNITAKRLLNTITSVVLHWTGGGASNSYDLLYSENKGATGYHYIIDRSGAFLAPTPIDYIAIHGNDANRRSVGISFMSIGYISNSKRKAFEARASYQNDDITGQPRASDPKIPFANPFRDVANIAGNSNNWQEEYSEAALNTCATIIAHLLNNVPTMSIDNIIIHNDVKPSKSDTGPLLDIESLKNRIRKKMVIEPPVSSWREIPYIQIQTSFPGTQE